MVPGLLPPPPPPLLEPPLLLQLTAARATSTTKDPSNAAPRSLCRGTLRAVRSNPRAPTNSAIRPTGPNRPLGPPFGQRSGAPTALTAVVLTTSDLCPFEPLPVRLTTLLALPFEVNWQVGRPVTCESRAGVTAHVSVTFPLKPVEVTVMGVLPDWPGAEILMVVFAEGRGVNVKLDVLMVMAAELVVVEVA